jgi:hypothetical protein
MCRLHFDTVDHNTSAVGWCQTTYPGYLAYALAENEVVTAEEFQMMVLLLDAIVYEYKIMGGDQNRGHLLFKSFPKNVQN